MKITPEMELVLEGVAVIAKNDIANLEAKINTIHKQINGVQAKAQTDFEAALPEGTMDRLHDLLMDQFPDFEIDEISILPVGFAIRGYDFTEDTKDVKLVRFPEFNAFLEKHSAS